MPDVREILNALSTDDQAVWNEHRTCMRRCYLAAVTATIGIEKFEQQDDSFLDLIDIRLALLFDRGGRLSIVKDIGLKDGEHIEKDIFAKEDDLKAKATLKAVEKLPTSDMQSSAVKLLNEWGSK